MITKFKLFELTTSAVLLRKLSGKSTLKFGKYTDTPIQQIIDAQHTRYLRWIYYNCNHIDFTDDIKNSIFLREEDEILKPGKDPEKGEKKR